MPASYPSSAKTFTTKSDGAGNTILAAHINDVQVEITAIEQDLLAGLPVARGGTGNTTLTANRVLLGNGTSAVAVAGAGTTGQVLTSNGASAPTFQSPGFTEETTTATGAQNNFDLDTGRLILRCTGAAPVFSGFTVGGSAPSAGDVAILECLGSTSLRVTHQDTNSTEANRIICPSSNGLIVGVGGRLLLAYDGTTDRWRASTIDPGSSIDVTHAGGNFTAQAGNWTVDSGDQVEFNYRQDNAYLTVSFVIQNTDVSATPSYLSIAIPGGFTAKNETWGVIDLLDAGATREAGKVVVEASATAILCRREAVGGANFSATAGDNTDVRGTITFEVT